MKNKICLLAVSALFALISTGCGPGAESGQLPEEQEQPGEQTHTHSFSEWSVKTPATYEAAGEEYRTCECGKEETRPLAKLEHEFAQNWSSNETKHWKACTDEGFETLKKDEADHTFGEWTTKTPATYDNDGLSERACTVCGYKETQPISRLVHNYANVWSKDENSHWHACTDEGYETLKKDETTHTFGEWTTKTPATFDSKEVQKRTCEVCGYEETKEVGEVVAHNYSDQLTQGESSHWYACTDEGFESLKKDEAPHVFGVWEVTTEPTVNAAGVESRSCSVCGKTETRSIEALTKTVSKGFVQGESTHYKTYLNDGAADEKLEESAHTFGEWTTKRAATYEATGLEYRVCTVCGKTETRTTSKLVHSYSDNWSSDTLTHFYACTDNSFSNLKKNIQAHIDDDTDGVCDVCGATGVSEGSITGITVTANATSLCENESVIITADVDVDGACDDEIVWSIRKSSATGTDTTNDGNFSIEKIDNRTIKLTATFGSAYSSYARYVRAQSAVTGSIYGSVKITGYWYGSNNARSSTLKEFLGDDYELPYNYGFRPSSSSGFLVEENRCYAFTDDTYEGLDVLARYVVAFENNGHFNHAVEDDVHYFWKDSVVDSSYKVLFKIYNYYGSIYVECYKYYGDPLIELNSKLSGYVGCDIPALPEDGFVMVGDDNGTIRCFDGNTSNFVESLESEGFVEVGINTYLSEDGTLKINLVKDYTYYDIVYTPMKLVSSHTWSANDKTLMAEKLGINLPFVSGFSAWKFDSATNSISSSSSSSSAYTDAVAAFDSNDIFTKETNDDGAIYKLPVSEFTEIVIKVLKAKSIVASLEQKALNEWKAEAIENALGNEITTALPEAVGTSFVYNFENGSVSIVVTGNKADYESTLTGAGFVLNGSKFVSEDETLEVELSDGTNGTFVIEAGKYLPLPDWPMDKIKTFTVGKEVPAPSVYTELTILSDTATLLTIEVGGSDFTTYISELKSAGLKVSGSGNARTVNDDDYSIYFTLTKINTTTFQLEFVGY